MLQHCKIVEKHFNICFFFCGSNRMFNFSSHTLTRISVSDPWTRFYPLTCTIAYLTRSWRVVTCRNSWQVKSRDLASQLIIANCQLTYSHSSAGSFPPKPRTRFSDLLDSFESVKIIPNGIVNVHVGGFSSETTYL